MIYPPGTDPLKKCVALLAEGVDRNTEVCQHRVIVAKVALLAEGVDRNPSALEPLK